MISGLAHIGLFVVDMEESVAFYTEKLGMKLGKSKNIDDNGKIVKIQFLYANSFVVECIQVPGEVIADRGRIEHLAMDVTNIEETKLELEKKGIKFNGDIVTDEEIGCKYITFKGPNQEGLEINQKI